MDRKPDAGSLHENHYEANMASLRFKLRSTVLSLIRSETNALAACQAKIRRPILDQYFALTANLGTHLFYMFFLPTFFWFGFPQIGLDICIGLALGVFVTGVVKDYLCLPRPLSPPVHRISMSGSACLEYGFPSTHSCNAITVALICLDYYSNTSSRVLVWWLVFTIIAGRLYNGMHGPFDCFVGGVIGLVVYYGRVWTADTLDATFNTPGHYPFGAVFSAFLMLAISISLHPQPVDDCPCYDDSVAFLSVLFGIRLTMAYYSGKGTTFTEYLELHKPSSTIFAAVRLVIGVASIVVWRLIAKRTLLAVLPPVMKVFEELGISLPRKYYTSATEYGKLPPNAVPGETIIEDPKQFRETMLRVRRSRGRSESVGLQSTMDYYEALEQHKKDQEFPEPSIDKVEAPRKRYDVEVITKVVVYSGISVVSMAACIKLFVILGI